MSHHPKKRDVDDARKRKDDSDSESDSESETDTESNSDNSSGSDSSSSEESKPCVTVTNTSQKPYPVAREVKCSVPLCERTGSKLSAAGATQKGVPKRNEDSFNVLFSLPGDPTCSFFGVYDGHGGHEASQFCCNYLSTYITNQPEYEGNRPEGIYRGYVSADQQFLKQQESCGTTVLTLLITSNGHIYVSNAGDCRCIISRSSGQVVALSVDHRPSIPTEKKRIEAAEHTVTTHNVTLNGRKFTVDRIDGIIGVSRAIGDPDFKDFDGGPEQQAVTCVPQIDDYSISSTDDFIVLGSDGLWDVMSNEDVANFVRSNLNWKEKSLISNEQLENTAKKLVDYAVYDRKSLDNVTAVIICLKGPFS